jgi:CheY-like chemotaxis protein
MPEPATKKRVLCVDGNENIISMLTDLLEELGHEPLAAAGLAAALRIAGGGRVDLYITENRLHDGSGAPTHASSFIRTTRSASSWPKPAAPGRKPASASSATSAN